MNRSVTARQLDRLGFDADLAASGAAALDLLCRRSYAMILVDRHMPGMDGFEFAALLREREAGGDDRTPIVMMTADQPGDHEATRLAREFDGLLLKPVTLAQLNAILPGRTAPAVDSASGPAPPEPPSAADRGPIDLAALARLMGSAEPATLVRIAARFCGAFAELQAGLEAAVSAQDRDAVAALAHTAKGSAATAAAVGIARDMERVQALAPSGDWTEIARRLERSRAELERVRRFVESPPGAGNARGAP